MQIPFFVTDSVAKLPRPIRVESIVRLRLQELGVERLAADRRPEGRYLKVMKASHRKNGAPVELTFNEAGAR